MTYRLLLLFDWALIATSLFNTVVLLWLGLTVLLNAERRAWGTWVAGGGLLFGSAFFIGHTAVVGRVLGTFTWEMELWWRLGWLVMLAAPYLWYVVMAWYSGALRNPAARRWLASVSLVGLLALALLLFGDPLPDYGDVLQRGTTPLFAAGPLPAVALIYPVYSVVCTLLALTVLRSPADSDRFMGEEARRRARPWLIAASIVLLGVSLAVATAATWVLQQVRQGELPGRSAQVIGAIIVFDLAVGLLIAVAIVLIGQAVVAYEIFTGKVLPRGELRRQWRRALALAAGYGLVIGWSLSGAGIPEQPIYQLLLATVLTTVFFALLGWRSFEERERALGGLRPFFAGQRLYEGLVRPGIGGGTDGGAAAPFHALCGEILGAQVAYLVPVGPLAALAGPPLALPARAPVPAQALMSLATGLAAQPPLCVPVAAETYGGAIWAVPLTGEGGLIGVLLLGPKRDGGLYTEEEMALARTAGERLVDHQAGAEMARRLVALQRRRLAEGQVLDRRARRLLHDEVLPRLHATMLTLATSANHRPGAQAQSPVGHGSTNGIVEEAQRWEDPGQGLVGPGSPATDIIAQLTNIHKQISDLLHDLPAAVGPEFERHGPLGALRRAVEAELAGAFDVVRWEVLGEAEAAARALDPLSAEALYYAAREAVRNAARHGRGDDQTRPLGLVVTAACRTAPDDRPLVVVTVEDDGVGLAPTAATSTRVTQPGDGGAGLALHSTILAILGGALSIESVPGATRITVSVPVVAYPTG